MIQVNLQNRNRFINLENDLMVAGLNFLDLGLRNFKLLSLTSLDASNIRITGGKPACSLITFIKKESKAQRS